MEARELSFAHVDRSSAPTHRDFVREHHYSRACPPGMHWFSALYEGKVVGAMLFRRPSLPKTREAYGVDLELSRLVMLDEAGRNSESRFIGWALRWLRRNTKCSAVISFADPEAGHSGIVYRASNWEYLGREKGHGTRRITVDGEVLHSKTAYDRYGASGSSLIQLLAPKKVVIRVCEPKHVYRYALRYRKD